jgi:hypothetical protein
MRLTKENRKENKNFFRNILDNPALLVILVVVLVAAVLFGVYGYIYAGRNVYAYVKGTPIYNYEMSNEIVDQAYANNVNLDSIGTDPKGAFVKYTLTKFAKRAVVSRRLYYLMGLENHFTCSKDELNKALYDFKKEMIGGTANPEQAFKTELSDRGITENELMKILQEKVIAQKEKDELTKNITITPEEVKKYFNEWSYAYVKKGQDPNEVFKNEYEKIKEDALALKKQQYLIKYTNDLIDKNKKDIVIDNRYKKFMRWFYKSLLNLAVPSQFKPGEI